MRRFGDLEAAIMDVMWAAEGPLPVREVVVRLRDGQGRELAYTTVQTVMDILFRKEWLDRSLEGRAYRYWARVGREDYVAALMADALEVSQDRGVALARFFEKMDSCQVAELRAALDSAKRDVG